MSENIQNALAKLDKISGDFSLAADVSRRFSKAFELAQIVNQINTALTPEIMEKVFMPLKDIGLGFRTDEDSRRTQGKPAYSLAVIKNCLIEATLRGAMPVGNEFNILASRTYFTKEYFSRMVREFPDLSNLTMIPKVPIMKDGGAIIECSASWDLNGKKAELSRTFAIRVNAGMGADAIQGKAKRKMLAAIYEILIGSEQSLQDGDVEDMSELKQAEGVMVENFSPPALAVNTSTIIIPSELGSEHKEIVSTPAVLAPKAARTRTEKIKEDIEKKKAAASQAPEPKVTEPEAKISTPVQDQAQVSSETKNPETHTLDFVPIRVTQDICEGVTIHVIAGDRADAVFKTMLDDFYVMAKAAIKHGKRMHAVYAVAADGSKRLMDLKVIREETKAPEAVTEPDKEVLNANHHPEAESLEATGEIEDQFITVGAVKQRQMKTTGEVVYTILSDVSTEYFSKVLQHAKDAKRGFTEKKKVKIQFLVRDNENWITDVSVIEPETEPSDAAVEPEDAFAG